MARKPVVIVTGASKGIGLAITQILLQKFHAQVVAISRSRTSELQQLSCEDLLPIQCDVADESSMKQAIVDALREFHHIDGLVLNAGTLDPIARIGDTSMPASAWKAHFDVNFFSLISTIQDVLPALRRSELGGRVIFISSGAATKGTAAWGPYNASKAAMNSLCRTLGEEEPGVISVALRPGVVDTKMQKQIRETGARNMNDTDFQKFTTAHATGKLLHPNVPGHVAAALAVGATKSLSGQFLSFDEDVLKEFRLTEE